MSFPLVSKSVTLNTLARAVLQKLFSAHSTELRRELYGYIGCRSGSISSTKLLRLLTRRSTLVYRSTLHDLLHDYQPTRTLRSSTAYELQRPPLISSFADRSFSIAAPTVWNSLSPSTRLLLLNLDLKLICLRQHILPIGRFSAIAAFPIRMRLGAVEICIDNDIDIDINLERRNGRYFALFQRIR